MNFFCVLTVLAAGITMANAKCDATTQPPCKYDCPLIGKDFYGSDIACGYNLAADWKACAAMCKAIGSCTHWTWLIDSVGKKCCLKTSDGGIRNLIWPGASGEVGCLEWWIRWYQPQKDSLTPTFGNLYWMRMIIFCPLFCKEFENNNAKNNHVLWYFPLESNRTSTLW